MVVGYRNLGNTWKHPYIYIYICICIFIMRGKRALAPRLTSHLQMYFLSPEGTWWGCDISGCLGVKPLGSMWLYVIFKPIFISANQLNVGKYTNVPLTSYRKRDDCSTKITLQRLQGTSGCRVLVALWWSPGGQVFCCWNSRFPVVYVRGKQSKNTLRKTSPDVRL